MGLKTRKFHVEFLQVTARFTDTASSAERSTSVLMKARKLPQTLTPRWESDNCYWGECPQVFSNVSDLQLHGV